MHLSSQNQLKESGRPPSDAIFELAADKSVDVIAFCESHWWSNPQRELLKSMIEPLSREGFTHVSLEIEQTYQSVLTDFSEGAINRESLEDSLRDAGASLYNPAAEACRHYFDVIETARDCGIKLVAMDKNRRHWQSKSFADEPREKFLANCIQTCLATSLNNRVVILSGNNHLYVRDPIIAANSRQDIEPNSRQNHLSMAEYLRKAGINLVSLAGVLYNSRPVYGLSFSSLYPLALDLNNSVLIDTNEYDQVLGVDKRCPWGSCTAAVNNGCPGIEYNICQNIPLSEIRLNHWDKLIFFDSSWWNKIERHLFT